MKAAIKTVSTALVVTVITLMFCQGFVSIVKGSVKMNETIKNSYIK